MRLCAMFLVTISVLFACLHGTFADNTVTLQGYIRISTNESKLSVSDFFLLEKLDKKLFYIPDVRITAKSRQTGLEYETYSDSTGFYSLDLPAGDVGVHETTPDIFVLHQNYPNPFNPSTTITYDLNTGADVSLRIYNISGQLVDSVVDSWMPIGRHSVQWNGFDSDGHGVSAGVYFYKLQAGMYSDTRKMLLLDGNVSTGSAAVNTRVFSAEKKSATSMEYDITLEKDGYMTEIVNVSVSTDNPIRERTLWLKQLVYFPLEVGNSWTFKVDKKDYEPQLITYTIIDTKEIKGHTYYQFDSFPIFILRRIPPHVYPDEVFVRRDVTGSLRIWEGTTTVVLYMFALSRPTAPLPVLEYIGADNLWEFYHEPQIMTILDSVNETVKDFYPCYRFRVANYAPDTAFDYWFAPEIGPVKIYYLFSAATFNLVSATIGGVTYDFGEE